MLDSLRGRLLIGGVVITLLFVGMVSWTLDRSFVASEISQAGERLQVHVYSLLATAEAEQDDLVNPRRISRALEKTRLNRQDSDLYGYVIDRQGKILWRSASAMLIDLPALAPLPQGDTGVIRLDVGNASFHAMGLGTHWTSGGRPLHYTFYVLEPASVSDAAIQAFRTTLAQWLALFSGALLLSVVLVTRWGLQPLSVLAVKLKRMQSGEAERVEGQFPRELQPVVSDLNALLDHEQKQRERYRNSLADLAHSFKTPLAVMQNAMPEVPESARHTLTEQINVMTRMVEQQLRRAMTKGTAPWSKGIDPAPALERVVAAVRKAYPDEAREVTVIAGDSLVFPGDEAVWFEIAGNLVENAFKHGGCCIRIELQMVEHSGRWSFRCVVEDDGEGIDTAQRERIFERGTRLDQAVPGQGIGLAMVADIIDDMGGEVRAGVSSLGGASFTVELPVS